MSYLFNTALTSMLMTGRDTARKIAITAGNIPWCDIISILVCRTFNQMPMFIYYWTTAKLYQKAKVLVSGQMYTSIAQVPTKYGLDLYLVL